jgi:hypothetical protein
MPDPPAHAGTSRRVDFSDIGDGWWKFLVEAKDPFQVLLWVAKHAAGAWSSRMLSPGEVRLGEEVSPPDARLLALAFEDERDAELFALWRSAPRGRA